MKASQLEEVDLGTRDAPKAVYVAKEMLPKEKEATIELLKEFRDMFTWSYEDMRGLDPQLYQYQKHLSKGAKPVVQGRFRMNPNYVAKLLRVGFIGPVKQATWLSSIVAVPKKNDKIRVCLVKVFQRGQKIKENGG